MRLLSLAAIGAALLWGPTANAEDTGTDQQPGTVAGAKTEHAAPEQTDESRLQALMHKIAEKQNLTPVEQQDAAPTIICRIERREGSRIKRNRCQTAAEWNQEREFRKLRGHAAKGAGRGRAWNPPDWP